jgi:hypothetical protein
MLHLLRNAKLLARGARLREAAFAAPLHRMAQGSVQ